MSRDLTGKYPTSTHLVGLRAGSDFLPAAAIDADSNTQAIERAKDDARMIAMTTGQPVCACVARVVGGVIVEPDGSTTLLASDAFTFDPSWGVRQLIPSSLVSLSAARLVDGPLTRAFTAMGERR